MIMTTNETEEKLAWKLIWIKTITIQDQNIIQ